MKIRDRVIEMRRVKASELAPHPLNCKVHGDKQRKAFRGLLDEIGFAGFALVYYSEQLGGRLTLIDFHMRQEEVGKDFEVPCLITDLSDAEAVKMLALADRLGSMADVDPAKAAALLSEIETANDDIDALLASLAEEAGLKEAGEVKLKQLSERPPPVKGMGVGRHSDRPLRRAVVNR